MKVPKKVLAIHDLSCVGRCSLSVIMPALSVLGIQVCPLPTALLSTHSAFENFTFLDLTHQILPIFEHFQKLSMNFDAVYSGFLGSEAQMEQVEHIFSEYAQSIKIVDPVMGDHGVSYQTITAAMREKMRELVRLADIVTPNLTEACLLLESPYEEGLISEEQVRDCLQGLCRLGPKIAILTGISMEAEQLTNYGYSKEENKFFQTTVPLLSKRFPGTGDLFAAAFLGYLLQSGELENALQKATAFLSKVIAYTIEADTPVKEGVLLEACLPLLL